MKQIPVRSPKLQDILIRAGAQPIAQRQDYSRPNRTVLIFTKESWISDLVDKYYKDGRLGFNWSRSDEIRYVQQIKERYN